MRGMHLVEEQVDEADSWAKRSQESQNGSSLAFETLQNLKFVDDLRSIRVP